MTKEQLTQIITKYHTHVDILHDAGEIDLPVYTDVAVCEIVKCITEKILEKLISFPDQNAWVKFVSEIYSNAVAIQIEMDEKFNKRGEV